MLDSEIQVYREKAGKDGIYLRGFTNLTRDRRVAVFSAWTDQNSQGKPVLFEIALYKSKSGWFILDSIELTAFPDEQEIIVKDGWPFFVKKVQEIKEGGQTMIVITLQ